LDEKKVFTWWLFGGYRFELEGKIKLREGQDYSEILQTKQAMSVAGYHTCQKRIKILMTRHEKRSSELPILLREHFLGVIAYTTPGKQRLWRN